MRNKKKDETGLFAVLLPFAICAAVLAVFLTVWGGCRGILAVVAFAGGWILASIVLLVLYVLLVGAVSLTVNMKKPAPKKDHPAFRRIVVYVVGLLCSLSRLRIHVEGTEKLPEGRFLLVSNHRSGFDPIATVWALRKWDIAFITKPENLKIPIAGPMIYQANFLPIDRENPRRAMETIRQATALLENDVVSVGVYPEGTRSRSGEMLPFHNGVFKIAQRAAVPLVICSVEGTEKIMKNIPRRATDVYLRVCEVLSPEAIDVPTSELGSRVREILEQGLEAAAEV